MYTIGIDLGGTNIVASVVDDEYKIIGTSKTPTNAPRSADEIFDDIAEVCEEAVKAANLTMADIDSVGMGTPGTVNQDGIIEFANNLAFNNVPARTMLAKRLNKPEEKIYIENDANCAALGEAYAGVGNGAKDFVAVTLGTGVGSGVIIDGKIVNGVNYAGGECGHMVIVVDGEQCSCGRKGCWEAYASATALIRQTKKLWRNIRIHLCTSLLKKRAKYQAELHLTLCDLVILQVLKWLMITSNMLLADLSIS